MRKRTQRRSGTGNSSAWMSHRRLITMVFITLIVVLPESLAQKPLLSPRDSVEIRYDEGKISIDYGRPSMRGRRIMGGLVPYNRWWRTGANEATSFSTDMDILLGDSLIPAGSYTLYTQPSEHRWLLIVNKQTGQWGTTYNQEFDLVRIPMVKQELDQPVETFTILLQRSSATHGTLRLEWELTNLSVPFLIRKTSSQ